MLTEEELIIYSHSNILPHSEITGSDSSTNETWEHVSISQDDKMHWEGKWPRRVCKKKNLDRRSSSQTNTDLWNETLFFLVWLGDFFFFSTIKMWQCWRQGKCFHGNQRLLVEMLYSFDRLLRNFESTPCSIPFDVNLQFCKKYKKKKKESLFFLWSSLFHQFQSILQNYGKTAMNMVLTLI